MSGKNLFLIVAILANVFVSNPALACSFGPGYKITKPVTAHPEGVGPIPSPPRVSIDSLRRGMYGDAGSCNDAGILTIVLEGSHDDVAGFTFKVSQSVFPDAVFPEALIKPIDFPGGRKGFRFVWLDLPHGQRRLEPLNATIEVRQISQHGAVSEPTFLTVAHDGGIPDSS